MTARTTPAAVNDSGTNEHALTFEQLNVPMPLVQLLSEDGKVTAFPIQADTLPDSMSGRDILGRGQTGSGKTLAYAIPLVARLGDESSAEAAMRDFQHIRDNKQNSHTRANSQLPHPRGLVLAPTRELVNQIDEVIRPLAQAYNMTTVTVYGGVQQGRQVARLRAGADIVVACPGRLEDLLRQRRLSLESVEITVLDEADEMADMGFLPSVSRLLEQVDPQGQHMLFSATLDHGVDKVVDQFLTDPKVHEVDSVDAHVDTMTHHVFAVSQGNKHEVIRELASGLGKRILFTRTKFQAQKMAKKLVMVGIPAVDLQGNLSQNQRDRHLAAFTEGQVRVLVATDVAARGIDVSDVALVVQTEPPEDSKSFLHRSGRTARAGEDGDVVTLVLPNQQRGARSMMRQAGIQIKAQEVVPGSAALEDLVGEHAPLIRDWTLSVPVASAPAGRSRRKGKRSGSPYVSGSGTPSRSRSNRRHGRSSESRDGFAERSHPRYKTRASVDNARFDTPEGDIPSSRSNRSRLERVSDDSGRPGARRRHSHEDRYHQDNRQPDGTASPRGRRDGHKNIKHDGKQFRENAAFAYNDGEYGHRSQGRKGRDRSHRSYDDQPDWSRTPSDRHGDSSGRTSRKHNGGDDRSSYHQAHGFRHQSGRKNAVPFRRGR